MRHHHSVALCLALAMPGFALAETPAAIQDGFARESTPVHHACRARAAVDGNNPLCGREVAFRLEILTVRDATDEEMKAGGAIGAKPNLDPSLMRPVQLQRNRG